MNVPLSMDQTLGNTDSLHAQPIFLDKSTVPWGQLLPSCQGQVLSAPFQSAEKNWINQHSAFMNVSCTLPQTGPDPPSSQISLDVTSGPDHVVFPSVNLNEAYSPPELMSSLRNANSLVYSQNDSPLIDLTDSTAEELPDQQVILLPRYQNATSCSRRLTTGKETHPTSDVQCYSPKPENGSQCDTSSMWLDLFLDGSNNLSFPDADLVESVISSETGSL